MLLRTAALLLFCIPVLLPVPARAQASPDEMNLLTRNTGWSLIGGRLFWTTDFGRDWRDITPAQAVRFRGSASIADVFFLDTSTGWTLLRSPSPNENEGWWFDLASTDNSGMSWTVTPLPRGIPGWDPAQYTLGGPATISFLDTRHGWVDLSLQSGSNFNFGVILATRDGGETWSTVGAPVGFGWVRFTSPRTGWAAGGPGDSEMVMTKDGGKSWREVQVAPPAGLPRSLRPDFAPPRFVDSSVGYLPVSFNGWAGAVYATTDGGDTWRAVLVLTGKPGSVPDALPVSIPDSTIVVPANGEAGRPRLSTFAVAGSNRLVAGSWPGHGPVAKASFVDASRGWVLTLPASVDAKARVLATTDGGVTWADATPHPPVAAPERRPARGSATLSRPLLWPVGSSPANPAMAAAAPAKGGGVGAHTSVVSHNYIDL